MKNCCVFVPLELINQLIFIYRMSLLHLQRKWVLVQRSRQKNMAVNVSAQHGYAEMCLCPMYHMDNIHNVSSCVTCT